MKVWVTIYVHEGGTIQCWEDAQIVSGGSRREYARIPDPNDRLFFNDAFAGEWFTSEAKARVRAN